MSAKSAVDAERTKAAPKVRGNHARDRSAALQTSNLKELLQKVQKLCTFWDPAASLEDNLHTAVSIAATIIGADSFVFVVAGSEGAWREVWHGCADADAAIDVAAIHRRLAVEGRSILLCDDDRNSPDRPYERRATNGGLLASPVKIGSEIVGFVCMRPGANRGRFDLDAVIVLDILATFIATSMQAVHLQNVLRSRFAQIALAGSDRDAAPRAVLLPLPRQMAKILAKTFYKEMTQAGFGSSEIVSVASEIVAQLSASLKRHRAHVENTSRDPGNEGASAPPTH